MRILALDTAMAACSAALVDIDGDEAIDLAHRFETRARGHAGVFAGMVSEVMADAGAAFEDLDRIGVTTGPGTFTGVRIGIAMARGLTLATGAPAIGVTTLRVIAARARDRGIGRDAALAVVNDARRGEVYLQCFAADGSDLTGPQVLPPDAACDLLRAFAPVVIGSGAGLLPDLEPAAAIVDAENLPDARWVARCAACAALPDGPPVPLYLRAPDAKLPAAAPLP